MSPIGFGLMIILIFVVLFLTTLTLIYARRVETCQLYPIPYCYRDWNCLNDVTDKPEVKDPIGDILSKCGPIDQARADRLNARGLRNIGSLTCVNNRALCPPYKPGDIDWTTCVPPPGREVAPGQPRPLSQE